MTFKLQKIFRMLYVRNKSESFLCMNLMLQVHANILFNYLKRSDSPKSKMTSSSCMIMSNVICGMCNPEGGRRDVIVQEASTRDYEHRQVVLDYVTWM